MQIKFEILSHLFYFKYMYPLVLNYIINGLNKYN